MVASAYMVHSRMAYSRSSTPQGSCIMADRLDLAASFSMAACISCAWAGWERSLISAVPASCTPDTGHQITAAANIHAQSGPWE